MLYPCPYFLPGIYGGLLNRFHLKSAHFVGGVVPFCISKNKYYGYRLLYSMAVLVIKSCYTMLFVDFSFSIQNWHIKRWLLTSGEPEKTTQHCTLTRQICEKSKKKTSSLLVCTWQRSSPGRSTPPVQPRRPSSTSTVSPPILATSIADDPSH